MKHILPEGLKIHCEACGVVVPQDAPTPNIASCAWVAANKMAWFDPSETLAGNHVMAVAAWALVHHKALSPEIAHPESVEYLRQHRADRKQHFSSSLVRRVLAPEHVEVQVALKKGRDAWLYADESR